MCLCVTMLVRNRLPNHVYYGDEAFAGDTVGLGLGQRLNFILKKLILKYFWGKIAPDEKNTVYIFSRCSSSPQTQVAHEWVTTAGNNLNYYWITNVNDM